MIERQWKLGEDVYQEDYMLDPITFEQIITALRCNEKVIDTYAVVKVATEIMKSRLEDFDYLLKNNINEIIAEAKKGRS